MGSRGIRRKGRNPRKAERLPSHLREEVADEGTPPIMWPDSGSGFEADPFSPAGQAQQRWALMKGLPDLRRGSPAVRWLLAALGLVVLLVLVGSIVSSF